MLTCNQFDMGFYDDLERMTIVYRVLESCVMYEGSCDTSVTTYS